MLEEWFIIEDRVNWEVQDYPSYSLQPFEIFTKRELAEPKYGTKGAASGRKWYVCSICGLERPEDEVVRVKGKVYCEEDFADYVEDKRRK